MFCFAKRDKIEERNQDEFVKDVIRRSGVFFNQLATHLPDQVVYFDHEKKLPFQKTFQGVLMFLDISGNTYYFTSFKESAVQKVRLLSIHFIF